MPKMSEIIRSKGAQSTMSTVDPLEMINKIINAIDKVSSLQGKFTKQADVKKNTDPTQMQSMDVVTSSSVPHTMQPTPQPVIQPVTEFQVIKTIDEEKMRKSLVALMNNIKDDPRVKIASMSQFIDHILSNENTQKEFAKSIKTIYEMEERK